MKVIYNEIENKVLDSQFKSLKENTEIYEQSGKLRSLISLLEECGLLNMTVSGKVESNILRKNSKDESDAINVSLLEDEVGDHRALIF